MLLGKDCGRSDDRHLKSGCDGPEGRPHGKFGFSVTHIAAQKAVHGLGGDQVVADLMGPPALIGGVLVGEVFDKSLFRLKIGGHGQAGNGFAHGLKPQHIGGVRADTGSGFEPFFLPALGIGGMEFDMGNGSHIPA